MNFIFIHKSLIGSYFIMMRKILTASSDFFFWWKVVILTQLDRENNCKKLDNTK